MYLGHLKYKDILKFPESWFYGNYDFLFFYYASSESKNLIIFLKL